MGLLLDTHAYLWFITNDVRLSTTAADRISAPGARVAVSVLNLWEVVIKLGTGKLSLREPVDALWAGSLARNRFEVLDVTATHVLAVATLPPHHRDPFDRLLVAQALSEGLEVVSADATLDAYPVARVW